MLHQQSCFAQSQYNDQYHSNCPWSQQQKKVIYIYHHAIYQLYTSWKLSFILASGIEYNGGIPLWSGVIDYQNELITPTFFMCNFAILLVKILKSHPCPKWSRVSPQPGETKPKYTSGFIIHVVKGFGWWFVEIGFIFWFINYSLMDWKVEKKTENNFRRPRKFVRKIRAWLVLSEQLKTIKNTPHPHNTQLWGMVVLNQLKTIKPSWYH